jgi:hypothetical protein
MAALAGSAPRAGAEGGAPRAGVEGGAPQTGAEGGAPRTGAEGGGLETWRQFRRQVLFSDVLLAPAAEFPTGAARVASLRRMHRTEIDGPSGFWRIQCVAFLDPPAPSGGLALRATDVTDPSGPREVKVFEVAATRGDREIHVDDLVLTGAMGFEANHRYEITVERHEDQPETDVTGARLGGTGATGKRDVYAKGVVTLR